MLTLDSIFTAASKAPMGTRLPQNLATYKPTVVRRLLELLNKAVINVQDEYGQTALHFVARGTQIGGKYKEVRQLLKDTETDLTLKDLVGRTASWYVHWSHDKTMLRKSFHSHTPHLPI